MTNMATELQFLVKEVPSGLVSPFLVQDLSVDDTCELLTTAGNFLFMQPPQVTNRLMVSGGVGIVSFMSVIRSVAMQARKGLLHEKVKFALIHSEKTCSNLPYLEEILGLSEAFGPGQHDWFWFDFTLCCTAEKSEVFDDLVSKRTGSHFVEKRADEALLQCTIQKFPHPVETHVYACGPGVFQKAIREIFLKKLGHSRSLIHLEFFDL
jgi:ferredoxin-NADP reductase